MNTKTITVNESGLAIRDGRSMINRIIDNQINNYKLQYITEFERDHSKSPDEKDQKVAQLEKIKRELIDIFKSVEFEDKEVDFSFQLEVNIKEKGTAEMVKKVLELA